MTNPETSSDLVKRLRSVSFSSNPADYDAVVSEAATTIERLTVERDEAREALYEAQQGPWPRWADEIAKKLQSYGVEVDEVEGWDLPNDLDDWLAGAIETETRTLSALVARQAEALRRAFGCIAFPVSTEIDQRGYSLYHVSERLDYAAEVLSAALDRARSATESST